MSRKSGAAVAKTTANLTTAYSGWQTGWLDVGQANQVRLLCTLVKDDADSVEFMLEASDSSESGYPLHKITSGTATLDEVTQATTDLSATDTFALAIDVSDIPFLRVSAKKTGGSGTVSLALNYLVGVSA